MSLVLIPSLIMFLQVPSYTIAAHIFDQIFTSDVWNLKTCGVPIIDESEMGNKSVTLGEKVTFNCKVDLSCMVSRIRWYHEMANGTEVLIKTSASPGVPNMYSIQEVLPHHQGMYTCVARNVVGKAFVAAYLEVAHSPHTHLDSRLVLVLIVVYISLIFKQGCS